MLSRLRIRTRLALVMTVPLVAVVGVAVLSYQTMQAVKVEGPSYREIQEAEDLVQDVVAPPEFLVESFLVVRQLATETDPAQIAVLTQQLDDLHAVYDERHAYWEEQLDDDPSVRFALLNDSYAPAQEFWQIVDERFLPAIEDGDRGEALRLTEGPLQSSYERHRDAVERVVRLATDRQEAVEAETASLVERRTDLLVLVVALVALLAVGLTALVVRSIRKPLRALEHDLPKVAEELETLDLTHGAPELELAHPKGHDELAEATMAFNSVVQTAVDLAAEQARIRHEVSETYLHLGRRNQNLLRRMLSFVTDLEQNERDAEALDHLFRLDHLATRMRRNAESLLVLAGAEPARTWSRPVPMLDVVRAGVSEIEDFGRVELVGLEPAAVAGTAASDVTHLLAELLENAALFSPPTTSVEVHGRRREDGYMISIVDHGLGMTAEQRIEARTRLDGSVRGAPAKMLGLHVVGRLAARHGLRVDLRENPSGGTVALVWLPFGVVGPLSADRDGAGRRSAPTEVTPVSSTPALAVVGASSGPASSGVASAAPAAAAAAPNESDVPPGPRLPRLAPATGFGTPPASSAAEAAPAPTAAASLAAPAHPSAEPADAGLRSRRRDGAPPPTTTAPAGAGAPRRSADEVRTNLARLQAGVRQARHDRPTSGAGGDR